MYLDGFSLCTHVLVLNSNSLAVIGGFSQWCTAKIITAVIAALISGETFVSTMPCFIAICFAQSSAFMLHSLFCCTISLAPLLVILNAKVPYDAFGVKFRLAPPLLPIFLAFVGLLGLFSCLCRPWVGFICTIVVHSPSRKQILWLYSPSFLSLYLL